MATIKRIATSFRLAAVFALLLSGLALLATAGAASASTAPGHTIATAGTLDIGGDTASGGGGPIDFWKVHLNGGDRVSIDIDTAGVAPAVFNFQLYAPGTTDATFPKAVSFSAGSTDAAGQGSFSLQAPYTGTFVFAVCEGSKLFSCNAVGAEGRDNPMDAYQFATTFLKNVPAAVAAREVAASTTIARARSLSLGTFQSGGANADDFWSVHLNGGDVIAFQVAGSVSAAFNFQLYRPGTTDANFPSGKPLSARSTNGNGTGTFDLKAPYTGTFVLAVCEGGSPFNCTAVGSGAGDNPMDPYTFTTKHIGGSETTTGLSLSAKSVTYGHEKGLKFSARVYATYGGTPAGKVTISDGRKTVCTIKLSKARGSCTPAANTTIPAGPYKVTASYSGNRDRSKSGSVTLTVKR
jgi:Bacterial Ig-like domain (group 3)